MRPRLASTAKRVRRSIRRLTIVQWSLFHWYAALGGAWGAALLVWPPRGPALALGSLLDVVAILVIIGGALAIAGSFLGVQPRTVGNIGLLVETTGLTFLQAGNVSYLFSQIALASAPIVGRDRYALIVFAYAVTASLLVRGLFLISNYRHVGEPASRRVIH